MSIVPYDSFTKNKLKNNKNMRFFPSLGDFFIANHHCQAESTGRLLPSPLFLGVRRESNKQKGASMTIQENLKKSNSWVMCWIYSPGLQWQNECLYGFPIYYMYIYNVTLVVTGILGSKLCFIFPATIWNV